MSNGTSIDTRFVIHWYWQCTELAFVVTPIFLLGFAEASTLVALIKHWFDVHPSDYSESVRTLLSKFIEGDLNKDGHRVLAQKIQQSQPEWERAYGARSTIQNPTAEARLSVTLKVPPEPKVRRIPVFLL
jgi:hypothetical protein